MLYEYADNSGGMLHHSRPVDGRSKCGQEGRVPFGVGSGQFVEHGHHWNSGSVLLAGLDHFVRV